MIDGAVWGTRLRRGAVLLATLAGSQLGHAIVYWVRFGSNADSVQATGAHAYFPALAGGLSAVLGLGVMACLLLVAAARSLAPAPVIRRVRATIRFFDLLPALFAAQVLLFMGQETIESLATSGHLPSLVELLVWGTFGQLPAASLASVALTWLLARLELVLCELRYSLGRPVLDMPLLLVAARPRGPLGSRYLEQLAGTAAPTRGPPAFR